LMRLNVSVASCSFPMFLSAKRSEAGYGEGATGRPWSDLISLVVADREHGGRSGNAPGWCFCAKDRNALVIVFSHASRATPMISRASSRLMLAAVVTPEIWLRRIGAPFSGNPRKNACFFLDTPQFLKNEKTCDTESACEKRQPNVDP
jgi:hypothetical protein